MHTLNSAVRTITAAFKKMLTEGGKKHNTASWLVTEDEMSAEDWLIDDVKTGKVDQNELYEAFVDAGMESDEAENLAERYFWYTD